MNAFKSSLTRLLPRPFIDFISSSKLFAAGDYLALRRRLAESERNIQLVTLYLLRQQAIPTSTLPSHALHQHELSVYSQNGEDGVLLYLFNLVGVTNRCFVEFGIGDGKQCNTANLSLNFGWSGLLLEVDHQKTTAAHSFYRQKLGQAQMAVRILPAQVTAENINTLLTNNQIAGDIDLLSIDIDGNDYWVWQAISVIEPRIVVIEYNPTFGQQAAITVPYDPAFDRFAKHSSGFYHGASLPALAKLGHQKGYILAGCDSSGANAFFVRQDVAAGKIEAITANEAFFPSYYRCLSLNQNEQWALIANMPFQEV